MPLPQPGDYGWARPLNDYIVDVERTADDATAAINDHATANDPHGVQAWAEVEFKKRFGSKIFTDDAEPASAKDGDLWISGGVDDSGVFKWRGSAWVKVADSVEQLEPRLAAVESQVAPVAGMETFLKGQGSAFYSGYKKAPKTTRVGTWVNFSAAEWPAFTYTAPANGVALIFISATCGNTNTTNAIAAVGVTCSQLGSSWGAGNTMVRNHTGTASNMRYAWLTKGTAYRFQPQWYISSGNSNTGTIGQCRFHLVLIPRL